MARVRGGAGRALPRGTRRDPGAVRGAGAVLPRLRPGGWGAGLPARRGPGPVSPPAAVRALAARALRRAPAQPRRGPAPARVAAPPGPLPHRARRRAHRGGDGPAVRLLPGGRLLPGRWLAGLAGSPGGADPRRW